MNKRGKIIIISGPSGSGKTTLYKKLLENPRIKRRIVKTVSITTRLRRLGEKNGRDYFFVSLKDFLAKKKTDYFLESQKVFDNYYGTPVKAVHTLLHKGKNVLLCIDVKGAKVVCRKFPDAVRVFIKVPSMAVLKKRLESRGSENSKTVQLRLETARQELKEAKQYDYIVINDELTHAYTLLEKIIFKELKAAH